MVSSLFIAASSSGEILGPFMSSFLSYYYDFVTAYETYSLVLVCFVALYILLCGGWHMFSCCEVPTESLGDEEILQLVEGN